MKDSSVIFMKDWSVLIKSLSDENQLYFWGLFMQYDHEIEIKCENEFVLPIWNFIKSQLDKMKEKYFEKTVLTNRNNGKLGGRPKKEESETNPNNPMGLNETQTTPKDKDNNNDKENENEKDIPPTAKEKSFKVLTEKEFGKSLEIYIPEFGKQTIRSFFDYWTEKSPTGKMKFQLGKTWDSKKRLKTWKSNEPKFGTEPTKQVKNNNVPLGPWTT